AAFADDYPKYHNLDIIPEREFEPYVRAGRFIMREHNEGPTHTAAVIDRQPIGVRRVLYAWRDRTGASTHISNSGKR
ncbi:MAG TPA: hypothetical protein VGL89_16665, partial [Candidatus Koribacter sp.]